MINKIPEFQGKSIVLVGNFNPEIYQPSWLALQKLIRDKEYETADIQIIHKDVTIFKLDWVQFEITRDRFSVTTTEERYYESMRDLILGIFSLLPHTPIKKMGINTDLHYGVKKEEDWHKIGDILAPKTIWKKVFKKPGMRALIIEESIRPDNLAGFIRIKIEPSIRITLERFGIYFNVNDHFEFDKKDINSVDYFTEILNNKWNESTERTTKIIKTILESLGCCNY